MTTKTITISDQTQRNIRASIKHLLRDFDKTKEEEPKMKILAELRGIHDTLSHLGLADLYAEAMRELGY
jgi:hypothetical protein